MNKFIRNKTSKSTSCLYPLNTTMIKNRVLLVVSSIIVACMIYIFDPMQSEWYPKCLFLKLTGFQCPGCGTGRAIYALLHGEFTKALILNPFLFFSQPYIIALLILKNTNTSTERMSKVVHHRYVTYAYLGVMICWWIGRNII